MITNAKYFINDLIIVFIYFLLNSFISNTQVAYSLNCVEYKSNGFHLMGDKNCSFCQAIDEEIKDFQKNQFQNI